MKIGITYDLRDDYLLEGFSEEETAEFDRINTIEAIETALKELGHKTDRIGNAKSLVKRLSAGERWELVFNIAEGMYGVGREAQVPAILDAFNIPYTFSDPLVLSLSLHKALTKRIARDLGVPTPDFFVVETEADIEKISLKLPLFAKPVADGTGKGITAESKIRTRKALKNVCKNLLKTCRQHVLVERFLPGREFTVGIVGTGNDAVCVGTLEVELLKGAEKDAYSYVNKERCEELVKYTLVENKFTRMAEKYSLIIWRGLGCRDAGRIDFRVDGFGVPFFLEINPLAGLHPKHSDLPILCTQAGIPYVAFIEMIVSSAFASHEKNTSKYKNNFIKLKKKYVKHSI
jgi:D-alanine-D-alanine ligase